jgi:hypothetical protein
MAHSLYSLADFSGAIAERQVIARIQVTKGKWTISLRDCDNPDDQQETEAGVGTNFAHACEEAFANWDKVHK